jgi:hypothetical protein
MSLNDKPCSGSICAFSNAEVSSLRRKLIAFDWPAHAHSYAETREIVLTETDKPLHTIWFLERIGTYFG